MKTTVEQRGKIFLFAAGGLLAASYCFCRPGLMLSLMLWLCARGLYKDLKFEVLEPRIKFAWCLLMIASVNILSELLRTAAEGTYFDARYTGYLAGGLIWIYASPRCIFLITGKLNLCRAYLIEKSALAKAYPTNSLYNRFVLTLIVLSVVELVRILGKTA